MYLFNRVSGYVWLCQGIFEGRLSPLQVMVQVQHRFVVRFMASFVEHGTLHIVMEWASGGDLSGLIRASCSRGALFDEETLWRYLIQLTEGLQHLHSRRILHRDIKPSNIFIDERGDMKIGDLGLGKILTGTLQCAVSKVGTPLYFSPEICEGKPYDAKSDMWALGCLMHELATMKPPFHAQNQIALAKKIVHESPEVRVPSNYSKELQFIIGKMLEKDPRKRPSADTLLSYSAVQIRIDRARFQERELELMRLVEVERGRLKASDDKAKALLETLREREAEMDAQRAGHACETAMLKEQVATMQSRFVCWHARSHVRVRMCIFVRACLHDLDIKRLFCIYMADREGRV